MYLINWRCYKYICKQLQLKMTNKYSMPFNVNKKYLSTAKPHPCVPPNYWGHVLRYP